MSDDARQAFSYLLRIWRVKDEGLVHWRALLEDPSSGERRGFADLEALFAYLRAEVAADDETDGACAGSKPS